MTYAPRRLFARPRALQNKSKILLIATFLLLLAVQQKQFWVQLLPSKSHVTGPFLNTRRDSDIIRLKDLPDLTTAYTKVSNGNHSFALSLIRENGNLRISSDLEAILPDNDEIEGLYGSGPVIFGLDTCKQFQSMYEPKERYIGIAGQMNSGTNAAGKLLTANFNHSANGTYFLLTVLHLFGHLRLFANYLAALYHSFYIILSRRLFLQSMRLFRGTNIRGCPFVVCTIFPKHP